MSKGDNKYREGKIETYLAKKQECDNLFIGCGISKPYSRVQGNSLTKIRYKYLSRQ